ncbi:hypothetical protein AX27061_1269 [Achromobacter xylosoxidans NBRC 15126 = ATCC 27061]|nr:hypothetical protein AX27061_1269 [Achromobacter xylosoxidans NBRC 15126 = ATCC 27061]
MTAQCVHADSFQCRLKNCFGLKTRKRVRSRIVYQKNRPGKTAGFQSW